MLANRLSMAELSNFSSDELRENLEFVVVHLAEHADFRGGVKELDRECVICQEYFPEELAKK
jgi:hypothetical protein